MTWSTQDRSEQLLVLVSSFKTILKVPRSSWNTSKKRSRNGQSMPKSSNSGVKPEFLAELYWIIIIHVHAMWKWFPSGHSVVTENDTKVTLVRPSGDLRVVSGCLPDDALDSFRDHASRCKAGSFGEPLEIEMIHLLNMVMMVMEPIDGTHWWIPLLEIPKCWPKNHEPENSASI